MRSMYFDPALRHLETRGKSVYLYVVNKDVAVDEAHRLKLFRAKSMSVTE